MIEVGMHEAKTRLSELVKMVQGGEQVYFTSRGKVVAELVLPEEERRLRTSKVIDELRTLGKKSPLGTKKELMEWRREGIK